MSLDSDVLSLLCATFPEVPIDVTTTIVASDVQVSWTLPSDNGSPIT